MGREIRMVPVNWDHPKQENQYDGRLQPMYDKQYKEAVDNWKAEFTKWEAGERPSYCDEDNKNLEYWEWENGLPDRAYYRPWSDSEAVWVQVWETVSEGTPVTPPFATKEELIDYLSTKGDFWDQKRGDGAWNRLDAFSFVNAGWAPSLVVVHSSEGNQIFAPRDGSASC